MRFSPQIFVMTFGFLCRCGAPLTGCLVVLQCSRARVKEHLLPQKNIRRQQELDSQRAQSLGPCP
jgi:hypothetical protein